MGCGGEARLCMCVVLMIQTIWVDKSEYVCRSYAVGKRKEYLQGVLLCLGGRRRGVAMDKTGGAVERRLRWRRDLFNGNNVYHRMQVACP